MNIGSVGKSEFTFDANNDIQSFTLTFPENKTYRFTNPLSDGSKKNFFNDSNKDGLSGEAL